MNYKSIFLSPARFLSISIFSLILIGSMLLSLPIAQKIPISFIDCFFTSTSAVSVTGLLTVPFNTFTFFGKCIILLLIQIGGIGLLTLTLIIASVFTNLNYATQIMVERFFELDTWKNARRMLGFIAGFTFIIELLSATIIYNIISPNYSFKKAIFYSIFHSVSSFCNAGLSIFGNSLIYFKYNIPMLLITGLLIFIGSFGFVSSYEILFYIKNKLSKKKKHIKLSLTTKIIISSTFAIIALTSLFLFFLESHHLANSNNLLIDIVNMAFNAIAYRSAGLTTIDIHKLSQATILLIMVIGFIGSSPASTGSGVKVTTFSIICATIYGTLNNKRDTEMKKRKISNSQVFKALAVVGISLAWIIISTFILLILNNRATFLTIFFESISSFTNLGLSTGLTEHLTFIEKLFICFNMFFGRLSSITLILALRERKSNRVNIQINYPKERIMIS